MIDRTGRLSYDKFGYQRGDEAELEKEIQKVLTQTAKYAMSCCITALLQG